MCKKQLLIILFSFLLFPFCICQNGVVYLKNSSFEGTPSHSTLPNEWMSCNFENQSPPDIQPGQFGVEKEAIDGGSYAGMVTRSDGTFEILLKELSSPLQAGNCYEWKLFIAQSEKYVSISRTTILEESFTNSVNLVIYGSEDDSCKDLEPLATYKNIKNLHDWTLIKFLIKPNRNYSHLIIALEHISTELPTNGHLLLDHFHPLVPLHCEGDSLKVEIPTRATLIKDIRSIKNRDKKIKELIEKINFEFLAVQHYLDYQLISVGKNKYKFTNIYLEELLNLFQILNKEELIIFVKEREMDYKEISIMKLIKSFIQQRKIKTNVILYPKKNKLYKKYKDKKEYELIFESWNISIMHKKNSN